MNRCKDKTLKSLTKKWYKKLEDSGFEDIEAADGNLKRWSNKFYLRDSTRVLFESKQEYYRMAGHFLHETSFRNERERLIWELHSEGIGVEDTISILKTRRFKAYKDLVHGAIVRLRKEMFEKYNAESQFDD